MAEILSLVKKTSEPDADVLSHARQALALVKTGEITAIYIIMRNKNGEFLRYNSGWEPFDKVAATAIVAHHALEQLNSVAILTTPVEDNDEEV
jgi:hypothetical protein